MSELLMRDCASASGYRLRHAPPDAGLGAPVRAFLAGRAPTTSTVPPERRLFVWFRHKQAAQALLADMLGDVPRLITVLDAPQLRGLPVRNPGTWIEVTNHEYVVPEIVKHQVKVSGLVVMELNDRWSRDAYSKQICDRSREFRVFRTDIAPDYWL